MHFSLRTLIIEHPFIYNLWSQFSLTESLTAAKRSAMLFSLAVDNQGFGSRRLLMIATELRFGTEHMSSIIVLTLLLN